MLVFFASRNRVVRSRLQSGYGIWLQSVIACPWGPRNWTVLTVMGIVMKKLVLLATALAMVSGSALAADMRVKAVKAPPPVAFDPWDIAFGSSIASDYVFRGITQSNHKPSVSAYFEPRYNITKDLQLYVGLAGASISFPNRAAAEIDIYGGIRPTFGVFAFDFGVWGYLYPGGTCFNTALRTDTAGVPLSTRMPDRTSCSTATSLKKNVSFYEAYGKVNYTLNDMFTIGANEYYSPNFLNSGAWGNYASITGKFTAPSSTFGSSGLGMYISGEFGRQWLGTSDSFYGTGFTNPGFAGRSRTASTTPTTTPGTSASASPTRCSRWISATPTPTCRRVIATPSPAISNPRQHQQLPATRHADQSGRLWLQLVRRDRHRQALG